VGKRGPKGKRRRLKKKETVHLSKQADRDADCSKGESPQADGEEIPILGTQGHSTIRKRKEK